MNNLVKGLLYEGLITLLSWIFVACGVWKIIELIIALLKP